MRDLRYYTDRAEYVHDLWKGLKGFEDFEAINYAYSFINESEYIRIEDSIDNDVYLNVEGLTKAEIFRQIAKVVLQGDSMECVPERMVTDLNEKRRVASMFREGGNDKN